MKTLIQNGMVLDFDSNSFLKKDILVEGSVIRTIGEELPGDFKIIDARGKYVTPGLIDAHSHIGISEEGMGDTGDDCCDYSGALTPELEVLDGIYPFDKAIRESVRAGVTTACVCPGSDGVVGGVASVISLTGNVADEMLVKRYTALKCALGENPKMAKHGFASRMGTAEKLRSCFDEGREYLRKKKNSEERGEYFRLDRGMENVARVLKHEMPIHVHAHRSDDICTAIRIAREYDVDMVIVHGTDALSVKEYLAKYSYPVIVGPTMNVRGKNETWGKTFKTAGELTELGIKVCITADHDVTPLYYLPVYAAMAVRYGMNSYDALRAITVNPAEMLHIQDKKGELKEGLDADIVIWDKFPLDMDAHVTNVLIEGKEMF